MKNAYLYLEEIQTDMRCSVDFWVFCIAKSDIFMKKFKVLKKTVSKISKPFLSPLTFSKKSVIFDI